MVKAARRQLQKRCGDFLRRLMRIAGEDDLVELFPPAANGVDDVRMAVTMGDDPPGRDGIDDAAAVRRMQIGAVGAHD